MSSCRVDMVGRTCTSEASNHSRMTARTSVSSVGSTFESNVDIDPDNTHTLPSPHDDLPTTSGSGIMIIPNTSSEALKSSKMGRKIVRFCNVHLREYGTCLGDNPSVSRGAPLSLDWNVKTNLTYSIDAFEKSEHYSANLKSTDKPTPLKRSSLERLHTLKMMGYSRREIKDATNEAERIKAQRFRTRRQVERREKIRALLNSIMCFFQFKEDVWDVDNLGDSLRTVSTRHSVVDCPPISLDIGEARIHETQEKSTTGGGRRKQFLKEEWLKVQKHWEHSRWESSWNRKARDSLDVARHSKTYSIDIPVELESATSLPEIDG